MTANESTVRRRASDLAFLLLLATTGAIGTLALSWTVTAINDGNYWMLLAVPVILIVMALPLTLTNGAGGEPDR